MPFTQAKPITNDTDPGREVVLSDRFRWQEGRHPLHRFGNLDRIGWWQQTGGQTGRAGAPPTDRVRPPTGRRRGVSRLGGNRVSLSGVETLRNAGGRRIGRRSRRVLAWHARRKNPHCLKVWTPGC